MDPHLYVAGLREQVLLRMVKVRWVLIQHQSVGKGEIQAQGCFEERQRGDGLYKHGEKLDMNSSFHSFGKSQPCEPLRFTNLLLLYVPWYECVYMFVCTGVWRPESNVRQLRLLFAFF